MPRIALVYHDQYDLHFGDHVFPSIKYKLIRQSLIDRGFARPEDFLAPHSATDEDMILVHGIDWVNKLRKGTISYTDILKLEIPYSQTLDRAFCLSTGGTILAARKALECGVGMNIGGGFHHAFPNHGEGFCAIHDVAVAVRKLQREKLVDKVMVIDCDVHHGNGTAAIFAGDRSVFTFSIHQFRNYPNEKPPSTMDIHLDDGISDEHYLKRLGEGLQTALPLFRPDLVLYVAGADPYSEDQLGGLNLSMDGLRERDRMVIELSLRVGAPVAITLAGGYAHKVQDTVSIHCHTAEEAERALGGIPAKVLQ